MATITLDIPDRKGVDLAEVKAKISLYAQYLISTLSHKNEATVEAAHGESKMSTLFGAIDITDEKSLDSMRDEALNEKYGI